MPKTQEQKTPKVCLGKWRRAGVPHRDWRCVEMQDLENDLIVCEMCETRHIRYVHVMSHADHADDLRCGRICAAHMEGDSTAAKLREKHLIRQTGVRARWLTRNWQQTRAGNPTLTVDGFRVTLWKPPASATWSFKCTQRATDWSMKGDNYPSSDAAALAALDAKLYMETPLMGDAS